MLLKRKAILFGALGIIFFSYQNFKTADGAAAPKQYAKGRIEELGGTNFIHYAGALTPDGRFNKEFRPTIATYHLNPSAVEAQMRAFYKSGQTKIILFLWYMPFDSTVVPTSPDVWLHVANSKGGQLSVQAQKNLKAILKLVKAIGFTDLTFRFGGQGGAAPDSQNPPWWDASKGVSVWSEAQYQENLKLIIHTRNIIENELSSTKIARLYDLGVELGGGSNQSVPYSKRLWTDYVKLYGAKDSIGFSIAAAPTRMAQLLQVFKEVGVYPPAFALDAYGLGQGPSMTEALEFTFAEMKNAGKEETPLIIQETYANDFEIARQIVSVLNRLPLKIKRIDQWPVYSSDLTINGVLSPSYAAYGGSTAPVGSMVASPCILAKGKSVCTTQFSWASINSSERASIFVGDKLMAQSQTGSVSIPWLTQAIAQFKFVSDQTDLAELSLSALPSGTPYLDPLSPGLSCDRFQCVVVTGRNLLAGCKVNIFTPDWQAVNTNADQHPSLITTVNGNCKGSSVSFNLPSNLINPITNSPYLSINLNVTNPNGMWSAPVMSSIDPPVPVIYNSELSCENNKCVLVNAANVSSGCRINIFTPDWSVPSGASSNVLATVVNPKCSLNSVSFEIPLSVRSKYNAINFNIQSPSGKWSLPSYLKL